ncbi:O-antigen ligase domain-containing protein [Shewanella pneumatophori]|uniref:O-antigen ligase domain-containing protein n=1 Tax=Shewanella pneumatophori TaxID=314092 RepID=A0A9X1ZC42_9GAMM|nr:O-antigen ligase domain-containing protein [Shewanella pneumatophori]MCL1139544.1 O-antigen ligase domain-containing protein [Shewanella pneumatophori]
MDPQTYTPENSDEVIVWRAITGTYLFWLVGAMYLIAPVIAWILLLRMVKRRMVDKVMYPLSKAQTTWVIAMAVMLLALVIGHLTHELGAAKLIKSSIGWAKGWALLAIFPLLGSLNIRPQLMYRACCIVCKHTLLLLPIFILAWGIGAPSTLYTSPLSIIGGPGPEFFSVSLYEIDPASGLPRWRLFTPWAPALGMVGNLFFIFAIQEQSKRYKFYGILGSLSMVLLSQSRLALVCYLLLGSWFMFIRLHRSPWLYFIASPILLLFGIFGIEVVEKIQLSIDAFKSARAGSTRVRQELANIAIERWSNEAIYWGHGIVERGPHLVEYMPIGSHHTWYGLLFVKGIFGAIALALPMLVSLLSLIGNVFSSKLSATAVAILLQLFIYTFGENLEILAYLFWPGLIVIGIAHKARVNPQITSSSKPQSSAILLPHDIPAS